MSKHLIHPMIASSGSQAALARRIGASPALVWQWLDGRRPISPKFARAIEAEFGISRHDLRPDIFGPTLVHEGRGAQ